MGRSTWLAHYQADDAPITPQAIDWVASPPRELLHAFISMTCLGISTPPTTD